MAENLQDQLNALKDCIKFAKLQSEASKAAALETQRQLMEKEKVDVRLSSVSSLPAVVCFVDLKGFKVGVVTSIKSQLHWLHFSVICKLILWKPSDML